jgi:dimethylargininase
MLALTRRVPPSITQCELTHVPRTPIDYARASAQHAAYERALGTLGCRIDRLPDAPDLPDSVFVEDAAVTLDEVAVIARPGAASRRAEVDSVAAALRAHRTLAAIDAPATLDGGDVLAIGRTVYVGRSRRTNADGARQLERALAPFGYRVVSVDVRGCLHLKSAVTAISDSSVVINSAWIDAGVFDGCDRIDVDESEPYAANVVRVGDRVLAAAAFPRTNERLAARGAQLTVIDVSEIAKAEGALTCCSLLLRDVGS